MDEQGKGRGVSSACFESVRPQSGKRHVKAVSAMGVEETKATSRRAVVILVYLAFVVDNMLLTVVVPILPEDLARLEMEDKPIFELPAVVIHQPNLLRTELTIEKIDKPSKVSASMGREESGPYGSVDYHADVTVLNELNEHVKRKDVGLYPLRSFDNIISDQSVRELTSKIIFHDARSRRRPCMKLHHPRVTLPLPILCGDAYWRTEGTTRESSETKWNPGKVHLLQNFRMSIAESDEARNRISRPSGPFDPIRQSNSSTKFVPYLMNFVKSSSKKLNYLSKPTPPYASTLTSVPISTNSLLTPDGHPIPTLSMLPFSPRSLRSQTPLSLSQTYKSSESSPAFEPAVPSKLLNSSQSSMKFKLVAPQSSPSTKELRDLEDEEEDVEGEVGLVLAVRSLVQLMVTPFVAKWSAAVGYTRPMIIGCCILLASTITFACARSVVQLALARSLHGLASSCIVITGLGLVASHYPSDADRGRMLGRVQGGVALGVVIGYPTGGLLYHLTDSPAPPFVLLAGGAGLLAGAMIAVLKPWKDVVNPLQEEREGILQLVRDTPIAIACTAICAATAAFPVLESCLPSHLRATIHPERWELGAMFLPDSLGYFAAASLLAGPAYAFGRPRAAAAACLLVALATFVVPFAGSVGALAFPHLGVGIGVGGVDAALLPLLAAHVDTRRPNANYAAVYALAQSAVAGAYCIGPLLGVWVSGRLGFPWAMRLLALCNLAMCPLLLKGLSLTNTTAPETKAILEQRHDQHELKEHLYTSLP